MIPEFSYFLQFVCRGSLRVEHYFTVSSMAKKIEKSYSKGLYAKPRSYQITEQLGGHGAGFCRGLNRETLCGEKFEVIYLDLDFFYTSKIGILTGVCRFFLISIVTLFYNSSRYSGNY